MKIFLIGMPGSGKTTLGKALAEALILPFVDLDEEIEAQEGISIADIFRTKGENEFRIIESEQLRLWASRTDSFVMATGGGAPCFYDGIDIINANGVSVYIDVPVETLVERTVVATHRPLLQVESKEALTKRLSTLLTNRHACYELAHITLTNPTVSQVLEALAFRK